MAFEHAVLSLLELTCFVEIGFPVLFTQPLIGVVISDFQKAGDANLEIDF